MTETLPGFEALNVAPELCERLATLEITTPTPIQEKAIPVAASGRDLVGIAQTGTGKTLAFALPMAQTLQDKEIALVLAPTRELAIQISETYKKLNIQNVLVIGGAPMNQQSHQLRGKYSVIIATPGRLIDHLNQGSARLDRVKILVLDEADRMLDMGFAPAIKRVIDILPRDRQTLLFSATMPKEIQELASHYMREPQRVEVTPAGSTPDLVDQELIYLEHEQKPDALRDLLYENKGTVLVFARTRHGARKLAKAVRLDGHTAAELHADRTLAQRKTALQGFKSGEYRILVATDIAARGIDVKDICLVINYDVPENPHDYVHRIGRTGRAGAAGRAVTLALPQQAKDIRDIERLLGSAIRISKHSSVVSHLPRAQARAIPPLPARPNQRSSDGQHGRGGEGARGRGSDQPPIERADRANPRDSRSPKHSPKEANAHDFGPRDSAPMNKGSKSRRPSGPKNAGPAKPYNPERFEAKAPDAPQDPKPKFEKPRVKKAPAAAPQQQASSRKPHRGWTGKGKPKFAKKKSRYSR